MNKKTIITIFTLLVIFVISACFIVVGISKKDLNDSKKDLDETIEKYGYVEEENISDIIAKFNTQVMESKLEYPANEEYLVVEKETYWYGLYDDISLYIKARDFTNDRAKDITNMMGIYYDKNSKNADMAQKYVRCLIKANNDKLTDNEIDYLIDEAENLSTSKNLANNGKGISVGLVEAEDHYEYQVKRLYK